MEFSVNVYLHFFMEKWNILSAVDLSRALEVDIDSALLMMKTPQDQMPEEAILPLFWAMVAYQNKQHELCGRPAHDTPQSLFEEMGKKYAYVSIGSTLPVAGIL